MTDPCGDFYRLSLTVQRPLACGLEPGHLGEHCATTPTGDVYWRQS